MKDKLSWALVIIVSMVLGAGIVLGIDSTRSDNDNGSLTGVGQFADTTPSDNNKSNDNTSSSNGAAISDNLDDVSDLYEAVRPSVVSIAGTSRTSGGSGSGIVLDKEGNILTNNHVVSGFTDLDITLSDGTSAKATIVGTDPGSDLAVIRADLPAEKLKPAKLGDSDKVRTGEGVIAVGNPFGIEGSLTQGVVSGLGRTLAGGTGRPLRQLIQSDAAINPGNSGGALFNRSGEVIGITTAIENPSGDRVFVGIGYAVPVNIAKRFLPDMLAGRAIQHPRLGVQLTNLTPALASTYNLNITQGVMLQSVEAGSAASRAGLRGVSGTRAGDVVVSIDGSAVKTFEELAGYIDTKSVGDKIQIKYVRDNQEQTAEVTLEAWRSTT
jgi:putative serine protease PepD